MTVLACVGLFLLFLAAATLSVAIILILALLILGPNE